MLRNRRNDTKAPFADEAIVEKEPWAIMPEQFDGADVLRVALTGDHPLMDYFSGTVQPGGFNNALVAEIAKRLGMNVELISVDSGAHSSLPVLDNRDVVFGLESGDFDHFSRHF